MREQEKKRDQKVKKGKRGSKRERDGKREQVTEGEKRVCNKERDGKGILLFCGCKWLS